MPIVTEDEFIASLTEERREPVSRLLSAVRENIPAGFEESIANNMVNFQVPLALYPKGYHVGKGIPLPYISIASEKGHIALHHFGLYMDNDLLAWFQKAYAEQVPRKLDMGKSCIRFKKPEYIPYDLVGELIRQRTVEQWVGCYDALRPAGK